MSGCTLATVALEIWCTRGFSSISSTCDWMALQKNLSTSPLCLLIQSSDMKLKYLHIDSQDPYTIDADDWKDEPGTIPKHLSWTDITCSPFPHTKEAIKVILAKTKPAP